MLFVDDLKEFSQNKLDSSETSDIEIKGKKSKVQVKRLKKKSVN